MKLANQLLLLTFISFLTCKLHGEDVLEKNYLAIVGIHHPSIDGRLFWNGCSSTLQFGNTLYSCFNHGDFRFKLILFEKGPILENMHQKILSLEKENLNFKNRIEKLEKMIGIFHDSP